MCVYNLYNFTSIIIIIKVHKGILWLIQLNNTLSVLHLYTKKDEKKLQVRKEDHQGDIDWVLRRLGSLAGWDEVTCRQYFSPTQLRSKTWVSKDRLRGN